MSLAAAADSKLDAQVEEILGKLTIAEKAGLCSGGFLSGGVPRLGIGQLAMLDGRQGVRPMDKNGTHTTLLPCALALSCTWDEAAAMEFSGVLAEEMLALRQNVLLAPMINLVRSPLGGRNFENFGEDPLLAGRVAAAYVRGAQSKNVGACACLLAANDCETHRHFTSSNMDERTLREVHLIPAELSFRDGGVWTMMSANSLLNGVHCAQNHGLLQGIVKDQMGFDGVMITDWRAAYDTVPTALAGTDITTGFCKYVFGQNHLQQAVDSGLIPRALLDDKARRILRLYIRSGVLDPDSRPQGELDSPRHRATARALAALSMVLLKNDRGLLPLDTKKIRKLLVTGPAANVVLQGGGSGSVPAAASITPLQGLQGVMGAERITFFPFDVPLEPRLKNSDIEWDPQTTAQGPGHSKDGGLPAAARLTQAAREADAVVFIAASTLPSEGHDLTGMDLPGGQNEAIAALAAGNPNLVVVLIVNGSVTAEPWLAKVPSLLLAHYPGQATGEALADVLTGQVNPSGKLSYTFGKKLADYPCHALGEWPAKPAIGEPPVDPGSNQDQRKAIHGYDTGYKEGVFVGYRWFDAKDISPLFPFGHGLSYSTFALSNLRVEKTDGALRVVCAAKNTGSRAGAEVVQVYVAPPKSSVPRPPKELKGFERVMLQPGETRQVEIPLRPSALAFFDADTRQWKSEAGKYEIQVGCSSRDIRLRSTIVLQKDQLIGQF